MNRDKLFLAITATLALLIILCSVGISSYVEGQLSDKLISQYEQQEGLFARQLALTVEREIQQTQSKLQLIAQLPDVVSGTTEVCNSKLKEIYDDPQTKVSNLGRVGLDGLFHCSLNLKLLGFKAEKLGTYIPQIFNDPAHAPVMSRAIQPPGVSTYVVAIHVPVWGAGKTFTGTLGGAVYLDALAQLYFKDISLAPGANITVFDDDGTVLYHYRPELIGLNIATPEYQQFVKGGSDPVKTIDDIKAGISGKQRYFFDNNEEIAVFEPAHIFPGRNWRILITVPVAAAHKSVAATGIGQILIELPMILGAFLLILLPFFVWMIRKKVLEPIEALEAQKTEFLSMASHQLRTPLGSMRWNLEYILAADLSMLPGDLKERLEGVYTSNTRLIGLVRDLLNVARIEAGRTKSEPVVTDVAPVLEQAFKEMAAEATSRSVIMIKEIPVLPSAFLDPQRLRESTQNLLSNAVKYTQKGGTVTLRAKVVGNSIMVEIQDTGAGIPKADQEKMFSKFFRAENARRLDPDGNGLGLYIVKSFVEEWGGALTFVSKEGVGTTFTYTAPIRNNTVIKPVQ